MPRNSANGKEDSGASAAATPTKDDASSWKEPDLGEAKPVTTGFPLEMGPPSKSSKKEKRDPMTPRYSGTINVGSASSSRRRQDSNSQDEQQTTTDISSSNESSRQPSPTSQAQEQMRENEQQQKQKLKIKLKTEVYDSIVKDSNVRKSPRVSTIVNYYPAMPEIDDQIKRTSMKRSRSTTPVNTPPPPLSSQAQQTASSSPLESVNGNGNGNGQSGGSPQIKRIKLIASPRNNDKKMSSTSPSTNTNTAKKSDSKKDKNQDSKPQDKPQDPDSNSNGLINNDFCSACGGIGQFLCCETCPRSFHFSCVDPPLDEDTLPEGEWHCKVCYAKKHPPVPLKRGLWSQLFNQLERRNEMQYLLPKGIRERYEGVLTLENGEYDFDTKPPLRRNTNATVKDTEDPLKTLDKNGNPILCHRCKESGLNGVQIVTCDYCPLAFHVDCVDPPIAQPTGRWKCPNHADQVPARLPRRPRKVSYEEPSISRGFKNNGNIEVVPSDELVEEESSEKLPARFYQQLPNVFNKLRDTPNGIAAEQAPKLVRNFMIDDVIYRLPEDSIKLDFVERIHEEQAADSILPESNNAKVLTALDELATKNFKEREAVRNLCYLQANESVDVNSVAATSKLSLLVDAAIGKIDVDERDELLAIQQLIRVKGKDKLMRFLQETP